MRSPLWSSSHTRAPRLSGHNPGVHPPSLRYSRPVPDGPVISASRWSQVCHQKRPHTETCPSSPTADQGACHPGISATLAPIQWLSPVRPHGGSRWAHSLHAHTFAAWCRMPESCRLNSIPPPREVGGRGGEGPSGSGHSPCGWVPQPGLHYPAPRASKRPSGPTATVPVLYGSATHEAGLRRPSTVPGQNLGISNRHGDSLPSGLQSRS